MFSENSRFTGRVAAVGLFAGLAIAFPIDSAKVLAHPRQSENLSRHAFAFEANRGQFPPPVGFVSRGSGHSVAVSPDGLRFIRAGLNLGSKGEAPVALRFENASQTARLQGERPLPFTTNYLLGSDPKAWRSDIPSYAKVRYAGLYPGIDAVFYGNPGQLEFDFEVEPGADPRSIRLGWDGTEGIQVAEDGGLLVSTPGGALRVEVPMAYQEVGATRVKVDAMYEILSKDRVGFRLGGYDRERALVIDPVLVFSSYFGGGEDDQPARIAVDSQGNHYVAGFTQSVNLPAAGSAYQPTSHGGPEAFVAKFNSAGNLLYSTYIGGAGTDAANDIAIDAAGNAYVCGSTSSLDFPTLRPASAAGDADSQMTYGGGSSDGFLLKLGPSGSTLLFSTFVGGGAADEALTVAVDPAGAAVAAGSTSSLDFPLKGAMQGSFGGGSFDVFIVKYSVTQARRAYATYFGGGGDEFPRGAAFDGAGALFLGGHTRSGNFPLANPLQANFGGGTDAFLSKFSSEGSTLLFSTFLGGPGNDFCFAMALDPDGNPVLAGESSGPGYPTRNAVQSILVGGSDATVSKLASDGSLIFSTYLGGTGNDSARGVAVGPEGDIFVTGGTVSSDFPVQGTLDVDPDGVDAFLSRFSPSGGLLAYSTYLDGDSGEIAADVGVDAAGNAYVIGVIDRPGLFTLNARQATFGSSAVYRSRDRAVTWQRAGQGISNPIATALAVDPSNPMTVYAGVAGAGVFKTVDGGANWNATGLTSGQILSLVVDPTASAVVYAGTTTSVFKTIDGGATWQERAERLPQPFAAFQALAIDPHDPNTLYVGTANRGIFKTTNGAESWRAVNNGLDRGSEQQVFAVAVDPVNSQRVYLGTLGTVFASSNGGSTWQATSLANVAAVNALAIDPQDTNTIYAGASSQFGNLVAKTSDAGVNWRAVLVDGSVTRLRIDPANHETLFGGTSTIGILKSTDGGTTWQPSNGGLSTRNVTALAVGAGNVYAGTSGQGDGFVIKVAPERIFYFPQVGDGVSGRIRFQTRLILINTGRTTDVTLEFFDSAGNPLNVTLSGLGSGSQFQFQMARGSALSAETPGQGPLQAGYARIRTRGLVGGTALFRRSDVPTGLTLYEAGVPASFPIANFSLLLDSLGNRDSGVAVVNAAPDLPNRPGLAELTLTLLDKDSNFVGEVVRAFPRAAYFAQFITQMFPEIADQIGESQGTLSVTTDQPMAAVTLRQNEDPVRSFPQTVPTLTALPVIPPNGGHSVFYFPQVGDGPFLGSRFQTSLILANTGPFPAIATIDFFNSAGEPLELTLEDQGTDSRFQLVMQPGGFIFLQTSGGEQLQVGYARVTTSSGAVGGVAVFSETDVRTGVRLYEAGVPASTPFQEFSLFADSTGIQDTGLALVNPDPEKEARVTLRLYDLAHHLIDETELQIGPRQHRALLLYQLFPDAPGVIEFQGVMTAESDRPLAAVTLRSGNDLTRQFPGKVPTLTTFPITPAVAPRAP